jgi:hypothetical protein
VERSVTDPNEREDHCDLNADGDNAQACPDWSVAQVLEHQFVQQANLQPGASSFDCSARAGFRHSQKHSGQRCKSPKV